MIANDTHSWSGCRNLLCIRADNMGDLIMSTPALRALKKSFGCRITVLTSSMGRLAVPFIAEVDDLIVADLPWVGNHITDGKAIGELASQIRQKDFDGVVIFTVYSQSSLPTALLTFMAGIPRRLAWCRENPYSLLTHWMPDEEPYGFIQHQVRRDLDLVEAIGATIDSELLNLEVKGSDRLRMLSRLQSAGIDTSRPFMIFHPGVSEEKRRYPSARWIATGQSLAAGNIQILVTGTANEQFLTRVIAEGIGKNAIDMAGRLTIGEFIAAVDAAMLVVAVNTSTVHIAAATQTPVVVLYANTNPQHLPWKVHSIVLPFSVQENLRSKNEIIGWVHKQLYRDFVPFPEPAAVVNAIHELIRATHANRHEHC